MKHPPHLALAAAGALLSLSAAANDADLQALRAEVAQMKQAYEQRIAALEKRLADTQQPGTAAADRPDDAHAGHAGADGPEIALVLSGSYTYTRADPLQASSAGPGGRERRIQGFLPSNGPFMPEARSFNLGESELMLSADIDRLFRGSFKAALAPDNTLAVEEAHVQTRALPYGLKLKAGRYYSGVGYANEQHPHEWDFSDAALPYQAFFGYQQGYDGVQLHWRAPTELELELGAETGRARNFPATDESRNKNGFMSGSLFARLGGGSGYAHRWRAGLSLLATRPRDREYEDLDSTATWVTNAFSGRSRTAIADFVWKWSPAGNLEQPTLKLQAEYFRRRETGTLAHDVNGASLLGTASDSYASTQSGWYAQAVWQFLPQWRFGYRHDRLRTESLALGLVDSGVRTAADFPLLAAHEPRRHTVMADWSPSGFARLRLQLAHDRTRPGSADRQVWLHYVMLLGAHGGHEH